VTLSHTQHDDVVCTECLSLHSLVYR